MAHKPCIPAAVLCLPALARDQLRSHTLYRFPSSPAVHGVQPATCMGTLLSRAAGSWDLSSPSVEVRSPDHWTTRAHPSPLSKPSSVWHSPCLLREAPGLPSQGSAALPHNIHPSSDKYVAPPRMPQAPPGTVRGGVGLHPPSGMWGDHLDTLLERKMGYRASGGQESVHDLHIFKKQWKFRANT